DEDRENPEDWTLDQNVVIHDKLPEQAKWNTDDDEFITAGDIELTLANDFEGTIADFAADDYVGQYDVVGQELIINVGSNKDTNDTIVGRTLGNTSNTHSTWKNEQEYDDYSIVNDT